MQDVSTSCRKDRRYADQSDLAIKNVRITWQLPQTVSTKNLKVIPVIRPTLSFLLREKGNHENCTALYHREGSLSSAFKIIDVIIRKPINSIAQC